MNYMKKLANGIIVGILILAGMIIIINLQGEVEANDLKSNLVGYWKMDSVTSGQITDSSGYGNTGTLGASPRDPVICTGKIGGSALDFDSASGSPNDNVAIGGSSSLNNIYKITIAAWVNLVDTDGWQNIIAKDEAYKYRFLVSPDMKVRLQIRVSSNHYYVDSQASISASTWTHIAGSYDGNTMKLYINGIQDPNTNTNPNGNMNTDTYDLHIGHYYASSTWYYPARGYIDEVRVYSRALAQNDLYNLAQCIVGHWRMDESSGNALDWSGCGHTGTLGSSPRDPIRVAGYIGTKALDFDSSSSPPNDNVDIATSTSLNNIPQITIAAWVKLKDTDGWQTIISKDEAYHYRFLVSPNMKIRLQLRIGGSHYYRDSIKSIPTDTWCHIAGTYDGSKMRLYIDCAKDTNDYTKSGSITSDTNGLHIGHYYASSNWYYPAKGLIDDVRIYAKALGHSELANAIYHYRLNTFDHSHCGSSNGGSASTYGNDMLLYSNSWGVLDNDYAYAKMHSYALNIKTYQSPQVKVSISVKGSLYIDYSGNTAKLNIWLAVLDASDESMLGSEMHLQEWKKTGTTGTYNIDVTNTYTKSIPAYSQDIKIQIRARAETWIAGAMVWATADFNGNDHVRFNYLEVYPT